MTAQIGSVDSEPCGCVKGNEAVSMKDGNWNIGQMERQGQRVLNVKDGNWDVEQLLASRVAQIGSSDRQRESWVWVKAAGT